MERLREKLHKYIDIYGVGSKKTLKISNELDRLVNIEIKKNNGVFTVWSLVYIDRRFFLIFYNY